MMEKRRKKDASVKEISTQVGEKADFHVKEAYKIIRTNLMFTLASVQNNIILVSSAESAAGKSLTCANLAISMAQTGKKVVLIDADMRKSVQHRIFGLTNKDGLSTILSGTSALETVVTTYQKMTLDILTAGPTPPNPVELLSSQRMSDLLNKLQKQYDYVFVDTPPVSILSDGLVLASKVGGTILVARQNQTTYDNLQKTVDRIKQVNGAVLGVIVNDVQEKNKPYGSYYYGSYYGSYDHHSSEK